MEGIAFYPISVGKVWTKRGKGINHRKHTKKVWQVYGFMTDFEGDLHFTSFRINPLRALWYKFHKAQIVTKYCEDCDSTFEYLVNKKNDTTECPNCEEEI